MQILLAANSWLLAPGVPEHASSYGIIPISLGFIGFYRQFMPLDRLFGGSDGTFSHFCPTARKLLKNKEESTSKAAGNLVLFLRCLLTVELRPRSPNKMKALARFLVIGLMLAGAVSGIAASALKKAPVVAGVPGPLPLCPDGACTGYPDLK